jgi:hypothetical protein
MVFIMILDVSRHTRLDTSLEHLFVGLLLENFEISKAIYS